MKISSYETSELKFIEGYLWLTPKESQSVQLLNYNYNQDEDMRLRIYIPTPPQKQDVIQGQLLSLV